MELVEQMQLSSNDMVVLSGHNSLRHLFWLGSRRILARVGNILLAKEFSPPVFFKTSVVATH